MVSEHIPKIVDLAKLGIFMVRLLFPSDLSPGFRELVVNPLGQSRGSTALCVLSDHYIRKRVHQVTRGFGTKVVTCAELS
jgi:hypothetical protein